MKKALRTESELIRKTWPKIRVVERKGEMFYQVDARKKGTDGKQEHFTTKAAAEKRAAKIQESFTVDGIEGLAMPLELRSMALTAEKMLAPHGKTILHAAEFYRDWLIERQKAQDSALVPILAKEWYEEKASGKFKKLRESTLRQIKWTSEILAEHFAGKRILEITTKDIQAFLNGQKNVGLQRKYNLWNLFSQFFNWCVRKDYLAKNPAEKIEITVEGKEVTIFNPAQAEEILNLCYERFRPYTLYYAISLFAGLRPEECQYLEWEQIDMEERTIHVLAETSKVKEARNVHIEENLFAWLTALRPQDAKGYVTPQINFKKHTLIIHIEAGFRGTKVKKDKGKILRIPVNPDALEWPQDVLRHSYGSYWLVKYPNRAQLAEGMGNSLQIIKKHYKRVVSKGDALAYWSILPASKKEKQKHQLADLRDGYDSLTKH